MASGTQSALSESTEAVPFDRLYRLSVDQYRRMAESGILPEGDRLELLDGLISFKPPRSEEAPDWLYRLSVGQYHEMARLGILPDGAPIELLEGWLVRKMSINPSHRRGVEQTFAALSRAVPRGWYVTMQQPITTADGEPEPDISVVRGDTRDYPDRHPGPDDLALVVEVANTSLADDRGIVKRSYARSGVATYWIVNIPDRIIEVYTEPSGPATAPDYARREDYAPADAVPFVIEGQEVGRLDVAELLP